MSKLEIIESKITDAKIVQGRLQKLEVLLPDGRTHEEFYIFPNKKVEAEKDDIRFKIGKTIGVETDLGIHDRNRKHAYDHYASKIVKIII